MKNSSYESYDELPLFLCKFRAVSHICTEI